MEQLIEKFKQIASELDVDMIYNMATQKFNVGNYQKAIDCYSFLLLCKPMNPIYNKALASCYQQVEQYTLASYYYKITLLQSPADIECEFYIGICSFLAKEYSLALVSFNNFINISKNTVLIERAQMYCDKITSVLEQN